MYVFTQLGYTLPAIQCMVYNYTINEPTDKTPSLSGQVRCATQHKNTHNTTSDK